MSPGVIPDEWYKKDDMKIPFNQDSAIGIIDRYEEWGASKSVKTQFKEYCKDYGTLAVAKELCKQDTWNGSSVHQNDMPTNKDELKAAVSEMFHAMGVKLDDKTEKFLEYNQKNVRWS